MEAFYPCIKYGIWWTPPFVKLSSKSTAHFWMYVLPLRTRTHDVIQGTSAQSAFFIKSTHNICLVTHLISILTASQWCRTPQFFNVLALRHFVTINIIHSNWLWQFFKWEKKKIAEDGPCATTIFGNVMQFPSRFFPSFHNGENKRSVATSSRPIFCPPKWWFYDCSARYYYSSPGTTFSYRILRLKKKTKNTFASSNVVLPQSATGWIRNTLLILIRMVYHIHG